MGSEEKERWRRIGLLFDQAVSLSGEERAAFLVRACAGDDDLRQEVAELLQSSDRASGFLGQPFDLIRGSILSDASSSSVDSSQVPADVQAPLASPAEHIGPYRMIGRIGEGGMGEVWRAEQSKPIRRQVALKLVKPGMDTRQVVARFEAERQALAWLDHPAIARVYDAGETPRGLPYFVMELVSGEPITDYCDRERLTVRERLGLFTQICEGVQHAHQRGIIHRDLKPSNILVTVEGGRPVPKIIDFGVAKATAAQLTDKGLYTEIGMMIGTPEYMSPEQAEMTAAGVDTRTDVYSLGAILYELLTGTLPFLSLREAGYAEIRRRIRETEPPRPSTRVSSLGKRLTVVAESRRTEPARLVSLLKGELDWIVLRAMEKDRTRRYGSPGELAADIERSRRNEPVLASPPGGLYRARKFIRRHRLGVGIATAIVIGLLTFAITMSVQSARIAREKSRADREAEASRRVTDFLVGLFRVSDPGVSQGATMTARELLSRGGESIEKDLAADPLIQARLMLTIGQVYQNLTLFGEAEPYLDKALDARRKLLGPEHPDTLASMDALALVYGQEGKLDQAEKLFRETLDTRTRVLGKEDRSTLATACLLGKNYVERGMPRTAVALLKETTSSASLEVDDAVTLDILGTLAFANFVLGRYPTAEGQFRDLNRRLRRPGKENLQTLGSHFSVGLMCFLQGKYDEARTLYREGFEASGRLYGPDHETTQSFKAGLAGADFFVGNREEAVAMYTEVLETARRVFGPDGLLTQEQLFGLGMMNLFEHRFPQAEEFFRRASDAWGRQNGPESYKTLWALNGVAVAAQHSGKLEEAERILHGVVAASPRVLGTEHPHARDSMRHLAEVYAAQDRHAEAEKLYKEALAEMPPEAWQDPRVRAASLFGLARLEARRGEWAQALGHLREAVAVGFDDPLALAGDPHLTALSSDPAFAGLAAAAAANSRRPPAAPTF
jgi:non-specific serine/threonine protein kinase/serine/threonine-protein kinase